MHNAKMPTQAAIDNARTVIASYDGVSPRKRSNEQLLATGWQILRTFTGTPNERNSMGTVEERLALLHAVATLERAVNE